ncbi:MULTISPECIES: hypothetical protein [unclassified Legionella]|uniref:hypothetical protein n=1 Tax=unclassified Legionella TaxID=2622702 RepID=UPI00105658A0|nr:MULTISPECIES: hypothetical protein [unclassified Legionella]MDI9817975.1 hypothetical protein [Legionella sp. PL877]
MRTIIVSLFSLLLILFSPINFANRILLTGKPLLLQPHGEYYSFPRDYQGTIDGYHFVFVGGVYRVCHINRQPQLANLDMLRIHIELGSKRFFWNCYTYDRRFFKIHF